MSDGKRCKSKTPGVDRARRPDGVARSAVGVGDQVGIRRCEGRGEHESTLRGRCRLSHLRYEAKIPRAGAELAFIRSTRRQSGHRQLQAHSKMRRRRCLCRPEVQPSPDRAKQHQAQHAESHAERLAGQPSSS